VLPAEPDIGIGGEMNYGVSTMEYIRKRCMPMPYKVQADKFKRSRRSGVDEKLDVPGRKIVHRDDDVAVGEKCVAEVRADEARSASYYNPQVPSPPPRS
jgi:hypothetical protein